MLFLQGVGVAAQVIDQGLHGRGIGLKVRRAKLCVWFR
jgi:hypothetical protein